MSDAVSSVSSNYNNKPAATGVLSDRVVAEASSVTCFAIGVISLSTGIILAGDIILCSALALTAIAAPWVIAAFLIAGLVLITLGLLSGEAIENMEKELDALKSSMPPSKEVSVEQESAISGNADD